MGLGEMIEAEAVGDTEAEGEAEGENTRVRLVARLDTEAELPATSVSTTDSTLRVLVRWQCDMHLQLAVMACTKLSSHVPQLVC